MDPVDKFFQKVMSESILESPDFTAQLVRKLAIKERRKKTMTFWLVYLAFTFGIPLLVIFYLQLHGVDTPIMLNQVPHDYLYTVPTDLMNWIGNHGVLILPAAVLLYFKKRVSLLLHIH